MLLRLVALGVAALAAACSSHPTINILPKATSFVPESLSLGEGNRPAELAPVTAADLVDQQGPCAAAAAQGSAAAVRGAIALQMTECEVVRRAGPPDQIEFGTAEQGERALTLTYNAGPRPGIFRFSGGGGGSSRGPAPAPPPRGGSSPSLPGGGSPRWTPCRGQRSRPRPQSKRNPRPRSLRPPERRA